MTRIGMGLTAAVTLPLLAVGAASIKMAMNAVESENLFEVSMGEMAGAARAWSEDLRKQLGLNEYEIRKSVGTFYSMTTAMGLSKNAAYDVSTGLTQLAYDMASFYNLDPETAFTKLRAGISGEIEPLKQLGIVVDENTVKQYAYQNGIAAVGSELTTSQKVMARYGVIMAATSNAQGDLARTIDSPTNKLRIMKEQMKMTATELGMQLLPAFNALLGVGSKLVSGVGSVVKTFSSLPAPVKTVILVLAGLAAAAGPALMVLARMLPVIRAMPAVLGMLKSGLLGLINPYTLVIAAAAAFVIVSLQVADAQAAAEVCTRRNDEVTAKYAQKLAAAAQQAGMTAVEFANLTAKYEGNYAAMGFAIQHGKESVELQQALAKVSKEHGDAIDKERAALAAKAQAQQDELTLSDRQKASAEAMKTMRTDLTNTIAQATMSEYQYTKFSLEQQYQARVADIQKSLVSEKEKNAQLLLAKQAYNAQVLAFEAQQGIAMIDLAMQQRTAWIETQKAADLEYLTLRQGLQAEMLQLGTMHLAQEIALLNLEKAAKIKAIQDDKLLNQTQKDELLAMLTDYYAQKLQLAKDDADGTLAIVQGATQSLGQLYGDFFGSVLDGFYKMGEGSQSFAKSAEQSFKDLAGGAIKWVRDIAVSVAAGAAKEIIAAQAASIALAIKSIMASVPFPLNLALAGGAIALVSALFHKIHLGEGGLVTRPTTALLGERGPELVIPLKKLGFLSAAGAGGGGINVRVSAHFYGDLKTDYDLDEISAKLSDKIQASIERGRRM